jgi:hypothetical protein
LEDFHPAHGCVAGCRGDLDADTLEHLEISTARQKRYLWKRLKIFLVV